MAEGTELGKAWVQIVPSARGISGSISNVLKGEANSAGTSTGLGIAGKVKSALAAAGIGAALWKSLSEGGKLIFTYYNQYDGDSAPEYDITVEMSDDNGETWKNVWTSDYLNGLNQLL